jgi:hypothetical protein
LTAQAKWCESQISKQIRRYQNGKPNPWNNPNAPNVITPRCSIWRAQGAQHAVTLILMLLLISGRREVIATQFEHGSRSLRVHPAIWKIWSQRRWKEGGLGVEVHFCSTTGTRLASDNSAV